MHSIHIKILNYFSLKDKSSSLAPVSVKSLMDDGDDVIHVNLGSGQTTAHLASLVCNTDSSVFAFGIQSDKHYEQVKMKLDKLGIRGRFKRTNLILCSV